MISSSFLVLISLFLTPVGVVIGAVLWGNYRGGILLISILLTPVGVVIEAVLWSNYRGGILLISPVM